ncbi:MAG: hypothetical protein FJ022_01220 [Chloroflexi bacterium]|nr:hypothetical protein [Chloroflexota bacterium]MBM3174539.1 hypothetical protein [Chloroflexota bacterium]MBM4449416.1 hypothetical protein [Chloroflexota bacterium]
MAKKHKKTETQRVPTKRELSRRQRQQKLQRIITFVGLAFFAAILGFIGWGYYTYQVKPLNQPVLKVNDRTFNMGYFSKAMGLYSIGNDQSQIPLFADITIGRLETSELVRQGAPSLGISVSSDDVKRLIETAGLPDNATIREVIAGELLTAKVLNEYFANKVPTNCEQARVEAMLLESKENADKIAARLAAGDNFTALAMDFSVESTTKAKGGNLGWLPRGYSKLVLENLGDSMIEEIADSLKPGMISQPVYDKSVKKRLGYWIIEALEKDEEKGLHVRGILVGTEEEAKDIKNSLQQGNDFATLVRNHSLHQESKEQNGDLGWFKQPKLYEKDQIRDTVTIAISEMEPGDLSYPITDFNVQTPGGYWLVRVLERDTRDLDEDTENAIKSKMFEAWLESQKENSNVEYLLDAKKKNWAIAWVRKNAQLQEQPK